MTDGVLRPARVRRLSTGTLVAVLAGGAAAGAALLAGSGDGGLTGGVEAASAASATLLDRAALALPFGYAFGAGMVAAVNPCGFALLPAYLGLYLGDEGEGARPGRGGRLLRAIWIGLLVTAGFLLLFGAAGIVLSAAAVPLAGSLPWFGLGAGVLLILAGGRALDGGALHAGLAGGLAARLGPRARRPGGGGYLFFGLAYGLASLGCTLPVFLAVVGSTLAADGVPAAAAQYLLYAAGMGFVITVLTLLTALCKHGLLGRVRRAGRFAQPLGAILLLLAGAYLVYYWLTAGGLLAAIVGKGL